MTVRKRILFEDVDEGPEWVITYYLKDTEELDDNMDEDNTVEVVLNAIDVETAVRYAQQYLKKQQLEDETSDIWKNAEIVSVELH